MLTIEKVNTFLGEHNIYGSLQFVGVERSGMVKFHSFNLGTTATVQALLNNKTGMWLIYVEGVLIGPMST